uniref:Uncharacterized protein n=1 Tax=Oryza glaberrima TaxID=4538 RepID=I1QS29_ORYGL
VALQCSGAGMDKGRRRNAARRRREVARGDQATARFGEALAWWLCIEGAQLVVVADASRCIFGMAVGRLRVKTTSCPRTGDDGGILGVVSSMEASFEVLFP